MNYEKVARVRKRMNYIILSVMLFYSGWVYGQNQDIKLTIQAIDSFSREPVFGFIIEFVEEGRLKTISNYYNESSLTFPTKKLQEQTIDLTVKKQGYNDRSLSWVIPFNPNRWTKTVALEPKDSTLRGIIRDSQSGEPLAADLTLKTKDAVLRDRSGTNGRFFFDEILGKKVSFWLKVEKEGFKPFEEKFNTSRISLPLPIPLERDDSTLKSDSSVVKEQNLPKALPEYNDIQGHIRDHNGDPAVGVEVQVLFDGHVDSTHTDSYGNFIFELDDVESDDIIVIKMDYPKHKPFIIKGKLAEIRIHLQITDLELDKKRKLKNFLIWKSGIPSILVGAGSFIWSESELQNAKGKDNEEWKPHFKNAELGRNGALVFGVIGAGCLVVGTLLHLDWEKNRKKENAHFEPLLGFNAQYIKMGITFKF